MTQPWWHYWWDVGVLAQIQAFFSVVGTLLAAGAIVYAHRVANRQFDVMDEQTAMNKRQLALAERQNEVIEKQLSRSPALTIAVRLEPSMADTVLFFIDVGNAGDAEARDVRWVLLFPDTVPVQVFREMSVKEAVMPAASTVKLFGEDHRVVRYAGVYERPLYPDDHATVARGMIHVKKDRGPARVYVAWELHWPGGKRESGMQGEEELEIRLWDPPQSYTSWPG
jgi:hypothetical protein